MADTNAATVTRRRGNALRAAVIAVNILFPNTTAPASEESAT